MKKILLSRTDNIGDVIFTLPMAKILKKHFPDCNIYFLGKNYTRSVVECCQSIDGFISYDDLLKETKPHLTLKKYNFDCIIHVFPNKNICFWAKKAKIPLRIGTGRRWFHLLGCNKRVNFSRKNSHEHEAQLNIKLLFPLGITSFFSQNEIGRLYDFKAPNVLTHDKLNTFIDKEKFNLILHPKSKGSAREWPITHFVELIQRLQKYSRINIIISGTKEDADSIEQEIIKNCPHVKNAAGSLSLLEFIDLIARSDALIACSTGPLHIAAALGKFVIGFYPPILSMLPSRWGPIGKNTDFIIGQQVNNTHKKLCNVTLCKKNKECICISSILPAHVEDKIIQFIQ
jgi:heptosyltransferase-3